MGNQGTSSSKSNILQPVFYKFPLEIADNLMHKPLLITNILVILDAKGQHFIQKYFSAQTPLFVPIKPYIELCNLLFSDGQLKDQTIIKQHYQMPISQFQINGVLTLKITEKKLVLEQSNDSQYYIRQSIVSTNEGLVFEQRCYSRIHEEVKQFYFEEDVQKIKSNISTLVEKYSISEVRKIIHQSYKRSKTKQIDFQLQSQIKFQSIINQLPPSRVIGNLFSKAGAKVSYCNESTALSTLSIVVISERFDKDYHEAQIDISQLNLKVQDIKDNQLKRMTFLYQIKSQFSQQMKVDPDEIYVNEITESKAIIAYPSFYQSSLISKQKKIFDQFEFCQKDFNHLGNKDYQEQKRIVEMRGGYPYYRPIGWKRFGLNIQEFSKKDKNDNWISKNNKQWAIMYHGVRNPCQRTSQGMSTANAIIKFGLRVGHNHVHEEVPPLITKNTINILKNKGISIDQYLSEQVYRIRDIQNSQYDITSHDNSLGQGIYGSPLLNQICVDQGYSGIFKVDDEQYYLAFQCRVKPESIYISSQQKRYWLVRNPNDVRPYGILIANRKSLDQDLSVQAKSTISNQYKKFCSQQDIF